MTVESNLTVIWNPLQEKEEEEEPRQQQQHY